MIARSLALALLVAAPAAAQQGIAQSADLPPARLDPELQAAVRCAALFSIVAANQARGAEGAGSWPPLAARGREFFVRVAARTMDSTGLDRAGIQALFQAEAAALAPKATRTALRVPCLALLDAAVPPAAER